METIINQLVKKDFLSFLLATMENNFSGFFDSRQKYSQAMDTLQRTLSEAVVKKEMEAISNQFASISLFSCVLGIQANYRSFIDPVGGNFLAADPEIYLREKLAKCLPEYTGSQQFQNEFYGQLDSVQKEQYQAVTEYICFFETVAPKLAHYYGYLLGNDLLRRVVPGYQPNLSQTVQYRMMLENQLGTKFDGDFLLKTGFSAN